MKGFQILCTATRVCVLRQAKGSISLHALFAQLELLSTSYTCVSMEHTLIKTTVIKTIK